MARELGRMMSIMIQAHRQVWLSQSRLTDKARKTLQGLPVVPGTVFGPAAQEALDRTIQVGQTRQQLLCLHRVPPPGRGRARGRGHLAAPRIHPPPAHFSDPSFAQGQARGRGIGRAQSRPFWPPGPVGPPNRPLGAKGLNTEATGPAIETFTHQQLSYWAAQAVDPWVLTTLTHRAPFEPLERTELKWLSYKTVLLLAITSAKRVGELHALSVSESCLRWNPDQSGITLWPNMDFLPKFILIVGSSHLRPFVNGVVPLPEGRMLFGFMSTPGACADELTIEMVIVYDFPPRLNHPLDHQELLRQEFRRVAARMGPSQLRREHLLDAMEKISPSQLPNPVLHDDEGRALCVQSPAEPKTTEVPPATEVTSPEVALEKVAELQTTPGVVTVNTATLSAPQPDGGTRVEQVSSVKTEAVQFLCTQIEGEMSDPGWAGRKLKRRCQTPFFLDENETKTNVTKALHAPITHAPKASLADSCAHSCAHTLIHMHRAAGGQGARTHTVAAGTVPVPGGRKKRDDLWSYFRYSPNDNKTQCLVRGRGDETDDSCGATASSCCGFKLSGKNTTNLKRHLFVD
ncbi:LOW QUALITY PROTEIN: uncharacterized protein LOC114463422 [Xyrichtys novacula]|uniref:LOW QUALITY PROTEIN: uncharacterized protein LOC114463422 n=1 Tax=Xyrichtys novacula TaxID=13765 RepID=A0AAV1EXB0_XYRNO|nr:LOW QUALITY PROTEIN: uncharacterized protein LOC114463422 [Xyrichtys novacula]